MRTLACGALSRRSAAGRAVLATAVLAGVASGCSGGSEPAARPVSASPRPPVTGSAGSGLASSLTGLRAVRPCPGIPAFHCGMLSVRLDPSGLAPGRLSLKVAVSDVAAAPRGVLVLLAGGPGQPGVPFVSRLAGRLGPALRGYRLVMLDQRGTGARALNCPALQRQMGASDLTVPTPAAVRSCAAAIGPHRRYFTTADTVADIEALRNALGVSRLTLDGVSYGSYVAEQFALTHPAQVSRLVLDSVVPSCNVDPFQLAGMRRTATVLRAVCAAQGCGADLRMPWGGPDTPLATRRAALAHSVARLTPAEVWPFDRATAAGNGIIQTCLYWPPTPAPPAAAAPRANLPRVPVLLLAGGRDLSTPLAGALAQAAHSPQGRLFVVPAAGHSVQNRAAGNPAQAEVRQFLGAR